MYVRLERHERKTATSAAKAVAKASVTAVARCGASSARAAWCRREIATIFSIFLLFQENKIHWSFAHGLITCVPYQRIAKTNIAPLSTRAPLTRDRFLFMRANPTKELCALQLIVHQKR